MLPFSIWTFNMKDRVRVEHLLSLLPNLYMMYDAWWMSQCIVPYAWCWKVHKVKKKCPKSQKCPKVPKVPQSARPVNYNYPHLGVSLKVSLYTWGLAECFTELLVSRWRSHCILDVSLKVSLYTWGPAKGLTVPLASCWRSHGTLGGLVIGLIVHFGVMSKVSLYTWGSRWRYHNISI